MPRSKNDPPAAESSEPAAESAPASEAHDEQLQQLRQQLAEAEERADRFHSNWQRSAADFQNWKRRADQEKAEAGRLGEGALIAELLRVLDDFERAFQALPPELRNLTWIEGMAMVWQKLHAILQMRGLAPIEAVGKDFDPYVHEAVMREEDADSGELTAVVAELQRGYRFHDRVLRASLVKIGRPRPTQETVPQSESDLEGTAADG